ncbi:MAG: DUF1990 domain-containing protein [Pirellulaceae bacterium]|nr:DUF1990 domain-containing protein [Pirellulaceae bacterium]
MRLLYLRKPSLEVLGKFLSEQSHLDFTYSAVGATAAIAPVGFVVDRTRVELGRGAKVFAAAKDALRRWQQFRLGWVDVWSPTTSLEAGQVVAIMGRALGVWWLNSCRVVFTVDDSGPISRFGFAYGTLPGHVECGEERFLIEWDLSSDRVFYDIFAFSKPNHILTRLGYPFARQFQKHFGIDSAAAMVRAVHAGSGTT